jgi:hypothetical protein
LADAGSLIVGAVRAVAGLIGTAVTLIQGRPRLTIEGDWGVSLSRNMKLTVRNPGPRDATIQDLYLRVRSHKLGTQTVRIANHLTYEGKGEGGLPRRIASGDPAEFNVMLGLLDIALRDRGYEGSCGITPVVEDGLGKAYKGSAVTYNIPQSA